jgi:type I restriction enzyme S subunit
VEVKPGYKQTEVGVIPAEWEVARLSQVADLQVGFAFKSAWFVETVGTRLLRGENVGYGIADWSETRTLESRSDEAFRAYYLNPGDVVIGMDRTFTRSGAKITVLREGDCPCLLVQRVGRFIPRTCDQRYLWVVLSSEGVQSRLRLEQKGMDIPHLSRAEILHPLAAFPRLPEQRAIAGALSDVDALIGALDQLIAKKRDLKQAAMQQLLTGETRLPGFHGEWEVKRLAELARIQRGASPRPIDSPVWFDENSSIGWVRISDVTRSGMFLRETVQRLSALGVQHSRPVEKGSLIMSICATVGRPIITVIDACIHDGFVVFDNLQADKLFIYYVLKWIEPDWSKHGQTGSQMNLNTGLINGTCLSLPPRAEQTAIAEVLSDMDAELAALERRRDKTRALKQGMMQELLTGRTRLI